MVSRTPRARLAGGNESRIQPPLGDDHLQALRQDLLEQLPRHLEPEALLQHFFDSITKGFGLARLTFQPADGSETLTCGKGGSHSADYQLTVARTDLGNLTLYRRSRFADAVLEQIEGLIGTLVWPLRAALLYQQALNLAMRDALTGLGNRTAMELTLQREIALASRQQTPLSLVVIDLDHFKRINDELGHDRGDQILREAAKVLRGTCRTSDGVFRFGGEEFVVALPQASLQIALRIAERFREIIADPAQWPETSRDIQVSASIGVSTLHAGDNAESLFRRADQAMYRAKAEGRNRVAREAQLESVGKD